MHACLVRLCCCPRCHMQKAGRSPVPISIVIGATESRPNVTKHRLMHARLAPGHGPAATRAARPTQLQPVSRGVKAMAGAEGDKPASPAPEAAASPQQAAAAAPEPKKEAITRVSSIPVVVRADGSGGQG